MNKKISIIISICFFINGCLTDSDDKKPKEIKNSIYYQYDAGFSLTLPYNWANKLDQIFGDIKIDMVSKTTPIENFSANVISIITHHSGVTDIPTVVNMLKTQVQQSSPGIEFLSDTVFVKNNVTIGKIIYKGDVLGQQLKFKQLLFIRNNLDIQIEFTDLEKNFDGRTEFEIIENSLSFL